MYNEINYRNMNGAKQEVEASIYPELYKRQREIIRATPRVSGRNERENESGHDADASRGKERSRGVRIIRVIKATDSLASSHL